ncbi:Protein tpx2 [Haplosporangium sp. Z 767]|nr:Protein tpx2 [Haplosporangium sp. Z 767]KAF9190163.1 Protein tpx2 [Haplosporangium sp. Z 11]
MDSPSYQSSVIESPSLRKHRDMLSSQDHRSSRPSYSLPSTTPLKSPGASYILQQRRQEQSIFYDVEHNAYPETEREHCSPTESLSQRPIRSIRPTIATPSNSSEHQKHAREMEDTLAKLLDDKSEASRQARSSISHATKSLEALRQSQRKSLDSAYISTPTKPKPQPLLRTTETEYDVSPSRTARLMTSPPAASFAGTPDKKSERGRRHVATSPPVFSDDRQRQEQTRAEDLATLQWLQNTINAGNMNGDGEIDGSEHAMDITEQLDQRYTQQTSVSGTDRETQELYQNEQHSGYGQSYSHQNRSPNSASKRRRSNGRVKEDAFSQKENIPNPSDEATFHNQHSFRSPNLQSTTLEPRTPNTNNPNVDAESSLLEVAETTTTITNQLRGVYSNLQQFFSPETEAKLSGAITAIGSQKANRIAKGLSSSMTKPRQPEFRSVSVKRPSSAPQSTRSLTQPIPFNFSERLNQLRRQHTPHLMQTPNSSKMKRSIRRTPVSHTPIPRPQYDGAASESEQTPSTLYSSTPVAQNRNVNEYLEMSKSPFIPLSQRKKLLEKISLVSQPEPTKRPLTKPKSPVLLTRTRTKSTAIPHEEQVLHDMAQHGGYKAHVVDRRIFESAGDLGVPKVQKPPLTIPKSPVFTKRKPTPLRSPIMPLKSRMQTPHQQQLRPDRTIRPRITQHSLVSSAESARRRSQEKHEHSIRQESPVNNSSRSGHPELNRSRVTKPTLTIPQPFSFETNIRGEHHQKQFHDKLSKWKQIEKGQQFKALPLPVYPERFIPKKSTRPVTLPVSIALQTDRRAGERELFDQEKQRKEKLLEDMRAEKAREDELRELQELRTLRQRLVPHPTPIRDYPRIEIHRSTRPLTVPHSPNIGEKRKRQLMLERETPHDYEDQPEPQYYQHHHQDAAESVARRFDTHDDAAIERERQHELERVQEQEFERRRLSSFSNSGADEGHLHRQDLVRAEIERQREMDAHHQQERESQQKSFSQVCRQQAVETEYGHEAPEYEQNKRRRLAEEVSNAAIVQPIFGRRMGRKSWLEANDL